MLDFKSLTHEEIQSLQVDAALRTLLKAQSSILDLNRQLSEALLTYSKVKLDLDRLKEDKKDLNSIIQCLRVVVSNA